MAQGVVGPQEDGGLGAGLGRGDFAQLCVSLGDTSLCTTATFRSAAQLRDRTAFG